MGPNLATLYYTILVHGGARSSILDQNFDPERKETLDMLVRLGLSHLSSGKDAISVVESIVKKMEDAPLFNANKGAVLNVEGTHEVLSCNRYCLFEMDTNYGNGSLPGSLPPHTYELADMLH